MSVDYPFHLIQDRDSLRMLTALKRDYKLYILICEGPHYDSKDLSNLRT